MMMILYELNKSTVYNYQDYSTSSFDKLSPLASLGTASFYHLCWGQTSYSKAFQHHWLWRDLYLHHAVFNFLIYRMCTREVHQCVCRWLRLVLDRSIGNQYYERHCHLGYFNCTSDKAGHWDLVFPIPDHTLGFGNYCSQCHW